MADIQLPGKTRHQTPRIDLTPMVDLGFILITFFIYTTTITDPKVMDINMPYKPAIDEVTAFIDTSTLTAIPAKNGTLYYYGGKFNNNLTPVSFNDFRKVIIDKTAQLKKLPASFSPQAHELHIIIKPSNDCNYENLVRLMDEMLINNVPNYAIVDISEEEKSLIPKRL
jgi:biopolymer transport protein ExbD